MILPCTERPDWSRDWKVDRLEHVWERVEEECLRRCRVCGATEADEDVEDSR